MNEIYRNGAKRALDAAVAATSLVVLSPVYLLIAIVVRATLGAPVLFRQQRPGLNHKPFTILKYRTMTGECDASGNPLPDDLRRTIVGDFLRKWSLDELPELWNVFKGEMSLIGPRPLLVEYLPYYSVVERRRHFVRPGITGLAQISGRNETTWTCRLRQDVFYVDQCSFLLDCRIVARTLAAVLRGDGGAGAIERLGRFRGSAPL